MMAGMEPQAIAVRAPLLNPNEPEARIVCVAVREGQRVSQGDLLCTLETTKSTADLPAEAGGYVQALQYAEGDLVRAGDILCYLSPAPDYIPAQPGAGGRPAGARTSAGMPGKSAAEGQPEEALPPGLRISQPALALARQHGLDLSRLPLGPLVTESMVRELLGEATATAIEEPVAAEGLRQASRPDRLIIYGGGGHGKSLIELIQAIGQLQVHGIVDDGLAAGEQVLGIEVLGGASSLASLLGEGVGLAVNAVGGIGDIQSRITVFRRLEAAGFRFPVLVHPSAVVEASASLSPGVQVFAQAYVGSAARVGFGAIVNTGAVVSHDCILGDYANISPGALLAGGVEIGEEALVGMGVTINLGVMVGRRARIGNSAVVKADVPAGGIVRAGAVWPE